MIIDSAVKGTVVLTQDSENAPTHLDVHMEGLAPGKHGFHVQ